MTESPGGSNEESENEGPIVRDKRRIDPLTGQVRDPGAATAAPGSPAPDAEPPADEFPVDPELESLRTQVAERTSDLQRLQAEYTNYRRRVERDRQAVQELALANVLAGLLPILDDLGRARGHGELEPGFRAVAEALEATVSKLGLQTFGEVGEAFDPTIHEALMHEHSDDVSEPTASAILQPGYRIGERILRPARVAVADPNA